MENKVVTYSLPIENSVAQKLLKILESGNIPFFYLTRPLIRNVYDLVIITILKSKSKAKIRGKNRWSNLGKAQTLQGLLKL